jgi:hypothetical protein
MYSVFSSATLNYPKTVRTDLTDTEDEFSTYNLFQLLCFEAAAPSKLCIEREYRAFRENISRRRVTVSV